MRILSRGLAWLVLAAAVLTWPAHADACTPVEEMISPTSEVIVVREDTQWCPRAEAVTAKRLSLKGGDFVLDCGGVVFDGQLATGGQLLTGISVDQTGGAVTDVTIRNCHFRNYSNAGIALNSGMSIGEGPGQEINERITIEDTVVEWCGFEDGPAGQTRRGNGIVVGPYSTDNVIDGCVLGDNRLTGVYLEAYSTGTVIRDSIFADNGWSQPIGAGAEGREGVAVDASRFNEIHHNEFSNNKYAGIALYKNCGESGDPRTMPADDNHIHHNMFKYHDRSGGAAIVVASRQGATFPPGHCTDAPAVSAGGIDYYRDFSWNNLIEFNSFINNRTSIKVMEHNNFLHNNTFTGTSWTNPRTGDVMHNVYDVAAGAWLLNRLGTPVSGVEVFDSITRTTTTNASGRTFVPVHGATIEFDEVRDRYYGCISAGLAPGNACETLPPLVDEVSADGIGWRCQVQATACPARSSYPNFPNFPAFFLDNCYGSDVLPDTCAARAAQLWQWCNVPGSAFTVTTTSFVGGVAVASTSYSGP